MINKNFELRSLLNSINKSLKEKNFEQAKTFINKSILINPNIPEVYNILGIINFNQDQIDESIKNFQKAIILNKNFSAAFCNLANSFSKIKKNKLAIYNFNKAIETDPKNFNAYYNFGNFYKNQDDLENSEKYFNLAIDLKPEFFPSYNNLFEVFDRSNQLKKLDDILKKSKNIFGNHPLIDFFLGLFEYKKKNYHEVIKIYENIKIDKNDFNRLAFKNNILAKSYDFVGDYSKAYNFFLIANKIIEDAFKGKVDKFNYIDLIEQRNQYFSKFDKKKWQRIYNKEEINDPVFLVGFPRSGTTLLDTILRSHNSINVLEEKPILDELLDELKNDIGTDLSKLENIDEVFYSKYRNIYFSARDRYVQIKKNEIFIDKLPLNLVHAAEINKFFPNAKFIFALRNPYDVVLSCFMQQFTPNNAMSNFFNLHDAAKLYDKVMSLWFKYLEIFDFDIYYIKYEDLTSDFKNTTEELLKFLKLEWSDDLFEFYKKTENKRIINTPSYNQVNMPLYKNSINRWMNYKNQFIEINPILEKWSKKFNY